MPSGLAGQRLATGLWHFSQPCLEAPHAHAEHAGRAFSASALCKCLSSRRQCRPGSVQPGHTQPFHTAPKLFTFRCIAGKSEDIYMPAPTAEPLCHSQRRGPLSPTPQAGIEHQETVHMTLKHRQDKVQFLKGRFI